MGRMGMMTAPWQRQGLGWIPIFFWDTQRREKGGGMDDRSLILIVGERLRCDIAMHHFIILSYQILCNMCRKSPPLSPAFSLSVSVLCVLSCFGPQRTSLYEWEA